ncbi:hypothetical protein A2823_01455 [Candidatus Nomurabacteria bacterium RIFCSPHIGHO2_01_FULL_41_91]|uniref:histidine kinase n=1 Tax=Candidatus Nomurabacteria bacterium RIFCSPLOWO2_12_FULL_41_10 TaxID=1801795 RepID=A0A1F6YCM8_9BACT|nr:MAG: hypothetical protein A2823_01455 [Candidatus Nomurabacteria bacterium RIFCSPHIGHO2_01_FULL_41_91]OGI80660.1 MAG: hypothetical protein A3D43_00835 [Candidatus Nomurabacteria bacterium RIFCSPHIGHO2_02_FULL_41_52]OGI84934.1 MAG: hypothetical protein A3F49_00225 [Candidatus Nomurabacteria bacterium RIFCSPHIGHO2_12_FULL_42_19]OGI93750.1 MAG: hypothetical protein A3A07_02910 [Candidatus Nomurabacteria bacterium RIFCSPLOWO2_01_FULL_41_52]OGJ04128.1 MAG: hypothetical protein A3F97_03445 [Candid
MKTAPIPENEKERLFSLYKLGLLDTKPEERFDRITRTATKIFNVPISTLTLIDAEREWFKSCQGLTKREGKRAISFCGHALLSNKIFVIPDTKKDKRFADNPMVIGKPFIRFYAGMPLMSIDGARVGVFCIKDTKPRKFSKKDEETLKGLANWAEMEINFHNLNLAFKEEEKTQTKLKFQARDLENAKIAARNVLEDLQIEKEKLAQSNARDEALLESIGEGLVAVDNDRRVIIINKVASDMLGWKAKDLIGKVITGLPLEDEMGNLVSLDKRPTTIALKTGKVAKVVYFFARKGKIRFPMAITATPIKLRGKTIGLIEIIRDITREKEIDKAKSEFISLASHQLKTPPTAIKLLIERLLSGKMGKFTEKQKEYFDDIQYSNQRMIDIVNKLLNVSRIELGTFAIQASENDVCAVVRSVLDELKLIIEKRRLKFRTMFGEKSIRLMIDESLFRMVIGNLVMNAVNYTAEEGEIQVECKTVNKGQMLGGKLLSENCFAVIVSNTGYGIPKNVQNKVFTKFFRADNAREKQANGTGLGLYIIKSILDHSGGSVWFTSQENKGSIFYVTIPMTGMRVKIGTKKLVG